MVEVVLVVAASVGVVMGLVGGAACSAVVAGAAELPPAPQVGNMVAGVTEMGVAWVAGSAATVAGSMEEVLPVEGALAVAGLEVVTWEVREVCVGRGWRFRGRGRRSRTHTRSAAGSR